MSDGANVKPDTNSVSELLEVEESILTTEDRCALTFLTIQAPGISRYCGLCGRSYLSENYLLSPAPEENIRSEESHGVDVDMSDANSGPRRAFLLDMLVTAFDMCLYCGGRFVG